MGVVCVMREGSGPYRYEEVIAFYCCGCCGGSVAFVGTIGVAVGMPVAMSIRSCHGCCEYKDLEAVLVEAFSLKTQHTR